MSFAVRPIGLVKTGFVWRPTISADATNWVLYSQAIAAGWDGVVPLDAIITVNSGIVLSANATSQYGFDTGSGFPVGTTLKLIMPGYVCGMGGAGGACQSGYSAGNPGLAGGPALRAQYAITIDAAGGVIAGGGGGGGGAAGGGGGGGGGGRTGRTGSLGGAGSYPGFAGTFSKGGDGDNGGTAGKQGVGAATGSGGNAGGSAAGGGGGGWGSGGGNGFGSGGGPGGSGGAGGAAVVGNSYITWINTGTRYGSIT